MKQTRLDLSEDAQYFQEVDVSRHVCQKIEPWRSANPRAVPRLDFWNVKVVAPDRKRSAELLDLLSLHGQWCFMIVGICTIFLESISHKFIEFEYTINRI